MSIAAFSSLPSEILCSILCHTHPEDLANIQLGSKKLYLTFLYHERIICQSIATHRRIARGTAQDQRLRPLFVLRKQWRRHQIVELLLPRISPQDESTRQGLHDLWDYGDAIKIDQDQIASEEHQRFMQSTPAKAFSFMISVTRTCAYLLAEASKDYLDEESHLIWHDQRRVALGLRPKAEAFCEIVLQEGVEFVTKVIVQKSEEAIDKFTRWYKPIGYPAISRLCDEYHHRMEVEKVEKNDSGT